MKQEDTKEIIGHRLEQAQKQLKDAQILLENSGSGRTIVNCAYYAAFYSLLALLQLKGKIPRKHKGALTLFDTEFVRKGLFPKEMSMKVRELFIERMEDDYKRLEPIPEEEARDALKTSESFVSGVLEFFKKQETEAKTNL